MNDILSQYPVLAILGPVCGLLLQKAKATNLIRGWGLLATATGICSSVVCCFAWANNWSVSQWHQVPILILLSVATSNLTSDTVKQTEDSMNGEDNL